MDITFIFLTLILLTFFLVTYGEQLVEEEVQSSPAEAGSQDDNPFFTRQEALNVINSLLIKHLERIHLEQVLRVDKDQFLQWLKVTRLSSATKHRLMRQLQPAFTHNHTKYLILQEVLVWGADQISDVGIIGIPPEVRTALNNADVYIIHEGEEENGEVCFEQCTTHVCSCADASHCSCATGTYNTHRGCLASACCSDTNDGSGEGDQFTLLDILGVF